MQRMPYLSAGMSFLAWAMSVRLSGPMARDTGSPWPFIVFWESAIFCDSLLIPRKPLYLCASLGQVEKHSNIQIMQAKHIAQVSSSMTASSRQVTCLAVILPVLAL